MCFEGVCVFVLKSHRETRVFSCVLLIRIKHHVCSKVVV